MRIQLLLLVALLLGANGPHPAHAEDLTAEQIRCRLDPACVKPGFRSSPFGRRGVEMEPGAGISSHSVDFHITFAYDSAELLPDSLIILDRLGKALADASLRSSTFRIAGHTDARGSDEYNLALSERRAHSVAKYLVSTFGIDRTRLDVKGLGKRQLFDPTRPDDMVNRRVQVINLSAQNEAAR